MLFTAAAAAAVALAVAPALTSAHRGCNGQELIPRQATTSLDPNEQCQYYNYQPVIDLKPHYPTVWVTATILPNDTTAQALFAQINATVQQKVPNIGVKPSTGTVNSTYDRSDPDCWWTWQGCTTPASDLGIASDLYEIPEPNTLGLTLDDGPNCSQNALYDYLLEQKQRASMFFIGSNVFGWPLQAIRALTDGHEICVHTWSHQLMTSLTNEQVFAELYYTRQVIKDIVGVTPRCWRPPQGDVDNRVRVIAQGLNLTNIIWNADTDDWRAQAPGSTVTSTDVDNNYKKIVDSAATNYTSHGAIILSHQSSNFTMGKVIEWLPQLKAAFAHVVPLASAYNWTTPYVETNYTYPDFSAYISGDSGTSSGSSLSGSSSGAFGAASTSGASATASGSAATASSSRSAGDVPVAVDFASFSFFLSLGGAIIAMF